MSGYGMIRSRRGARRATQDGRIGRPRGALRGVRLRGQPRADEEGDSAAPSQRPRGPLDHLHLRHLETTQQTEQDATPRTPKSRK